MITVSLSGIIIFFLSLLLIGLGIYSFFTISKLKNKISKDTTDFADEIKEMKSLYEKEINELRASYEKEETEMEKLFESYKERTVKEYQSVIDEQKKTIELYESYMIKFNTMITMADDKLNEIDIRGTFKSDDEVGWFFSEVKDIQAQMNKFKLSLIERKGLN